MTMGPLVGITKQSAGHERLRSYLRKGQAGSFFGFALLQLAYIAQVCNARNGIMESQNITADSESRRRKSRVADPQRPTVRSENSLATQYYPRAGRGTGKAFWSSLFTCIMSDALCCHALRTWFVGSVFVNKSSYSSYIGYNTVYKYIFS